MDIKIKKAIKAGNSAAVILPRSWLNREVRIELIKKTSDIILLDTIKILDKHIKLKEVIGIYLAGSYARSEESESSDIDILVITQNTDKEMIHEGIYNIFIISKELLKQKLEFDLFPTGQMIKEAKPLLNSNFINSIDINVTETNVKWYIETTKEKLEIIKKIIDRIRKNNIKYVNDKVAYTLVLRLRTFFIIEKLIKNRSYSKNDFEKLIKRILNGENAYKGYLSVKNNLERKEYISIDEIERLYEYLNKQLIKINKFIKDSK